MSRWIDADATKLAVIKATTYGDALRAVKEQPSIDIVRCKECRFGQWHEQAEEYICIAHDQDLFGGDHFCSYGERRA